MIEQAHQPGTTLAELVEQYMDERQFGSAVTAAGYSKVLRNFVACVGWSLPAAEVATGHIVWWLENMGGAQKTKDRCHSIVRGWFRWMVEVGYLATDPNPPDGRFREGRRWSGTTVSAEEPPSEVADRNHPTAIPLRKKPITRAVSNPPNRNKQDLATAEGRLAYFQQALLEQELSASTIRGYCADIRQTEWFCEQRGYTLRNVPAIVLAQYVESRPKTYPTRLRMRASAKQYWTIFKRKNPPLWVLKVPRKPRMVCRALTEADARRLSDAALANGGRPGLAVLFGLYMALRRQEICTVRWDDIRDDGWLDLIGKGDLAARLPLHPVVRKALDALPHDKGETWVFPARPIPSRSHLGHVNGATVWEWVVALGNEIGVTLTTHQLRHTALATANDNTGDLKAVQGFARHSKIDTTSGYTRTTERRMNAVVAAISYEVGAAERVAVEQRLAATVSELSGADLAAVVQLAEELGEGRP